MSDFNINSDWKTKVAKGSIHENEYVKVSKNGDWEIKFKNNEYINGKK